MFVYGTLRLGGRLNPVLAGDKFIRHTATSDARYDLIGGSNFPFMIHSDAKLAHRIRGDLYDVSEKTLSRLDEIEGYNGEGEDNFYSRETIMVKNGDVDEQAFVYVCNEQANSGNTRGIIVHPEDSSKEWREP